MTIKKAKRSTETLSALGVDGGLSSAKLVFNVLLPKFWDQRQRGAIKHVSKVASKDPFVLLGWTVPVPSFNVGTNQTSYSAIIHLT